MTVLLLEVNCFRHMVISQSVLCDVSHDGEGREKF